MPTERASRSLVFVVALLVGLAPLGSAQAAEPCPPAYRLPQLTLDDLVDSAVPIYDRWQIVWEDVPISDMQLAQLAGDDQLIDVLDAPMRARGSWTYIGMVAGAAGTALSSTGWVLYGQDQLSQGITLPLAIGGIVIGLAGLVLVTESIQRGDAPFMAPTPRHRLSRAEARRLVALVNQRLFASICTTWRESGAEAAP